jgi:hypothetical protein
MKLFTQIPIVCTRTSGTSEVSAIMKVMRSNKFCSILGGCMSGFGPMDGGCLIVAKALSYLYPSGKVLRIVSERSGERQTEHYGFQLPDGQIVDGGGVYQSDGQWVRHFGENEMTDPKSVNLSVEYGVDPDSDIPDIPDASKSMAQLFMKALGKRWSLSGSDQPQKTAASILRGYKIVDYDPAEKRAFSLYDPATTVDIRKGAVVKYPGKGLFLGTTRKFCMDYYSGLTDLDELMLVYEFSPSDILKGSIDQEGEIAVSKARLASVEKIMDKRASAAGRIKTAAVGEKAWHGTRKEAVGKAIAASGVLKPGSAVTGKGMMSPVGGCNCL